MFSFLFIFIRMVAFHTKLNMHKTSYWSTSAGTEFHVAESLVNFTTGGFRVFVLFTWIYREAKWSAGIFKGFSFGKKLAIYSIILPIR